jgi:hypothetical protein
MSRRCTFVTCQPRGRWGVVLKKAGQSQGRLRTALRVLQFLPDTHFSAGDASNGSGNCRSCVEFTRAAGMSHRRKFHGYYPPECEERARLETEASRLSAEWQTCVDDVRQTPKNDPSRAAKVAEARKARARRNSARGLANTHITEHGCWRPTQL